MDGIASPHDGAVTVDECAVKRREPHSSGLKIEEGNTVDGIVSPCDEVKSNGCAVKRHALDGSRCCCVKVAEEYTDNAAGLCVAGMVSHTCGEVTQAVKVTDKCHTPGGSGLRSAGMLGGCAGDDA